MKTKIILIGEDREDEAKMIRMLTVDDVYVALDDICSEVFRPAKGYGYEGSCHKIATNFFSESVPEAEREIRYDLVEALQTEFFRILDKHNIQLND
jgi:hypothetical protein